MIVARNGPRRYLARTGHDHEGTWAKPGVACWVYSPTGAIGAGARCQAAASSVPPRIVAADDLLAANALLGAAASAGQVAGPLAASAALALSGFPAAFIVDAVSYLIGAAVVAPLPLRPAPAPGADRPGWRRELSEGLRLVARRRAARLVIAVSAAVTFTRLEFLDNYDARFVIVTRGPIDEALEYKRRVGNKMTWYSTDGRRGQACGLDPGSWLTTLG